jgi:hypothetical protein
MVTLDVFATTPVRHQPLTESSNGLSRLFAAAVVNRQFRDTLLQDPRAALADGYLGQTFSITDRERSLLCNIRAESLTDLAQKVNRALKFGL